MVCYLTTPNHYVKMYCELHTHKHKSNGSLENTKSWFRKSAFGNVIRAMLFILFKPQYGKSRFAKKNLILVIVVPCGCLAGSGASIFNGAVMKKIAAAFISNQDLQG